MCLVLTLLITGGHSHFFSWSHTSHYRRQDHEYPGAEVEPTSTPECAWYVHTGFALMKIGLKVKSTVHVGRDRQAHPGHVDHSRPLPVPVFFHQPASICHPRMAEAVGREKDNRSKQNGRLSVVLTGWQTGAIFIVPLSWAQQRLSWNFVVWVSKTYLKTVKYGYIYRWSLVYPKHQSGLGLLFWRRCHHDLTDLGIHGCSLQKYQKKRNL